MGLFSKNEASEYKALEEFSAFVERILSEDEYLSRKTFADKRDAQQPIFNDLSLMEEKGVLVDWCKRNKVDYKKLQKLMADFSTTETKVQIHNESYVERHLKEERDYLDHVLEKDDPNIKLDEGQRRVVLSDNIGEEGWRDKNVKYTTYNHLETVIPRCEVRSGDFVIAKMMPAGRTIEVPNLGTRICLGSDAMKFVPNKVLNKRFLLYAMRSQTSLSQVYGEVHGITRVRTTLNGVKSYVLPIPPLAEQQRIVDMLDMLLASCSELNNIKGVAR